MALSQLDSKEIGGVLCFFLCECVKGVLSELLLDVQVTKSYS